MAARNHQAEEALTRIVRAQEAFCGPSDHRSRTAHCLWPDLIVGLAIAAMNAGAAREVWSAHYRFPRVSFPLNRPSLAKEKGRREAGLLLLAGERGCNGGKMRGHRWVIIGPRGANMPLVRLKDEYLEQDGVRFLMADETGNTVACRVSHEALRDHADRVHLSGTDSAVFEAYRELIEDVASEAFDAEGPFDEHGRILVTPDALARVTRSA